MPRQVLNWDLRPVTIYDFVRSFCDLLSTRTGSSTTMRQGRGDVKELRIGAEEIADLSACGEFFYSVIWSPRNEPWVKIIF